MKESHFNRFVAISFVISIIGTFAIVYLLQVGMKSSIPYKKAVEFIRQDKKIIEHLGKPINEGIFLSGVLEDKKSSGDAKFAIPISGPKGSGTVHAVILKKDNIWTISVMLFQYQKQEINLLE
ncbi:cytochrome c oxidase assembly factor Coa1 family protein [Candidatus Uabimicrobium sp. HlEnr_7]|uniref:cytochrome c oxidase assembly factor Coa1 family protein n=1 Tax=Candidatus Uabimicrobium helgolandensis TaxID=3095367 RepID=UPI003557FFD4